jgi:hypothetical protein
MQRNLSSYAESWMLIRTSYEFPDHQYNSLFCLSSVLPMGNGVGAPTGYIINGPPTNMTSAAQLG